MSFLISYAGCTIASASLLGHSIVIVFSHWDCRNDSCRLLWRHRPIYLGTHKHCPFYSAKSPKIYRCWIVWRNNIYVVIIPSFLAITYIGQPIYLHFVNRFQFIPSTSYLGSFRRLRRNTDSLLWSLWHKFYTCLGRREQDDSNGFGRHHDREYPGDGLNRIQDPQGVLESYAKIGLIQLSRWETQLSTYRIHNHWIRNGTVCRLPGSHRDFHSVESGLGLESVYFGSYYFSIQFSRCFPPIA